MARKSGRHPHQRLILGVVHSTNQTPLHVFWMDHEHRFAHLQHCVVWLCTWTFIRSASHRCNRLRNQGNKHRLQPPCSSGERRWHACERSKRGVQHQTCGQGLLECDLHRVEIGHGLVGMTSIAWNFSIGGQGPSVARQLPCGKRLC